MGCNEDAPCVTKQTVDAAFAAFGASRFQAARRGVLREERRPMPRVLEKRGEEKKSQSDVERFSDPS